MEVSSAIGEPDIREQHWQGALLNDYRKDLHGCILELARKR